MITTTTSEWFNAKTREEQDALSRATRDAAEKFTADAIAAGKEVKPPEGFIEYPEDYVDRENIEPLDDDRDFIGED